MTLDVGWRDRPAHDRDWVRDALRIINADAARSADTHLHRVPLPAASGVELSVKDESGHPTGSLKHRRLAHGKVHH